MSTPRLRAKEGRFAGCIGGRDAVLLGWLFTHLLLAVEPHLVYIAGRPVFFLTTEYLFPFLHRSGGCVEWLSLLLAQSFTRDWLGALVLTLEAGVALALLQATLAALAEEPPRFLRYLPFTVLVMLDTRYDQLAAVGPALITALAAALLYRRLPAGGRARALGFSALAAAVYYGAAGSFGKLGVVLVMGLFSLLCALFEGRRRGGSLLQAAAYPLLAAGIAFAGEEYLLRYSTPDWGDLLRTPLSWSQGAAVALFGVTALWAKEPGLDSDPEVQGLRRVMLRQDDVQQVQILLGDDKALFLPEQALRHLLAADKTNRMAFEYLMATYLLQRRLDLLAGEIHRLDDFGDKEIPLLYQQALAIYADDTGKMPDLHGRRLEPAIRWHCRRFASIVGRLGPEQAAQELKKEYGGTYFYYYRFGGEPGR